MSEPVSDVQVAGVPQPRNAGGAAGGVVADERVDAAAPPDRRRWIALAVIGVAELMVILDASIVNIALPSAQADLGISDADRQWVVTAYTLTFGGLLLLGGRIADYWGRKRTFIVGLLGFAGASALGGAATSAEMLFAARGLQGAFGALLAPAALSLISVTFVEPKERARAFSVFGALAGGGAAIGLVLGGTLTEYASWRWCLFVNVPIALLTVLAAIPIIRESRAHGDTRYDVPGAIVGTAGLVALVYGFTEAAKPDVGWAAPFTISCFVLALLLLIGFVMLEARVSNPLLPLRIPRDRNRGGSFLVFLLVNAGMFAMFLFLTFYLQAVLGYSPLKSGFAFLPFSGGIMISAAVVSQLLPRIGPKPLIVGGLVMATGAMFWLTQISPGNDYVSHVLPAMIVMSVGLAGVFIPSASTALVGVGGHDAGVASAVLNTSQQVGGSLGLALLNTLYASAVTNFMIDRQLQPVETPFGLQPPADALVHGYTVAFFWGALLLLAALVVAVFMINATKADLPADLPAAVPADQAPTRTAPAKPAETVERETAQVFDVVLRGYDRDQVEARIHQLEAALQRMTAQLSADQDELHILGQALDEARRQPSETDQPSHTGLGHRIEQLLNLAEEQASEIVAAARESARRITASAKADAARVREFAQRESDRQLATARKDAGAMRAEAQGLLSEAQAQRGQLDTQLERELATRREEAERQRASAQREVQELTGQLDTITGQLVKLRHVLGAISAPDAAGSGPNGDGLENWAGVRE